jgi:hypothetical protein
MKMPANSTVTTVSIADEETVTIDASSGTLAVTNFTTTDMTSLTVTGDNTVNVGTSSGTKVATVDVSGLDAAFTGVFTASTVAMTVTGNAGTSAGVLTVTTGGGTDTITGGNANDDLTGGAGNDVIRGGNGDDAIKIGSGSDKIVFEATGAANDLDTITVTNFSGGSLTGGADVLDFSAFLNGGSVEQKGGATTAINAFTTSNNDDYNIDNKVVLLDVAANTAASDAETDVVNEIQGTGNAFSLSSGAKAVVLTGLADGSDEMYIAFVDDSVGATAGTIEADDVVIVGQLSGNFDLDTLTTANFDLIA